MKIIIKKILKEWWPATQGLFISDLSQVHNSWAVFFNTPTKRSQSLPFHQHHGPSFHENLNTVEDIVQIIHAERREPDTPRQTGIQRILSETQTKKSRKKKRKNKFKQKKKEKKKEKKKRSVSSPVPWKMRWPNS